jgi:hypothetical protein
MFMKWPVSNGIICRWVIVATLFTQPLFSQENSIRFYGNGVAAPDNDRVKIALTPESRVNVALDFTIECWLRCSASSNNGKVYAAEKGDGWIGGNIFIDRGVYGSVDAGGDYGLSIGTNPDLPASYRVVAFGIERLGSGITITGTRQVADNNWHHIAVTRNAGTGEIKLFVDGYLEATGKGPSGNINYNTARPTAYPESDPFLVLGAEKHDAGTSYPGFNGQMDELRVSDIVRYYSDFKPASAAFTPDSNTAGLYHFNEGTGTIAADASKSEVISPGQLHTGGSPGGPVWVSNSPFSGANSSSWKEINARKENQKVILNWITEPVNGSFEYEIERSSDGVSFGSVKRISSKSNCIGSCQYTFIDNQPLNGKNFYRVRNTGVLGDNTYSATVNVVVAQKATPFRIYQNGNNLVVQNTSGIESLVIWNREGRRLAEKKNINEGTTYVPLQNSRGFAFVHIGLPDGTRFTEKIVLR